MGRRIVSITLDNLDELPAGCRECVFWELDPAGRTRAEAAGHTALEKEAWFSSTLLEWGACGNLLYVDEVLAGFITYTAPAYSPRSIAFPTSPVGADAVLLMTAHLLPEFRGGGLGRVLVQGVAKDLLRRGVRAIETFGDARGEPGHCVLPAGYLTAVGFKTIRPHAHWPRLRLDLRGVAAWREDMEVAIERLLGSVNPDVLRPVGGRGGSGVGA